MPKGVPNAKYTGEFKQQVVEYMHKHKLSYSETERAFGITSHDRIPTWERIYLEEGSAGLYLERRGRSRAKKPKALAKQVEEDLIVEVQRLRAENDYLKNLNALVLNRKLREKRFK